MALNLTQFNISNKVITVFVPNQVTKDMVLQETNLHNQLREEFVIPDLIFDVQIDSDKFPDYFENKFVPTLSQKDKYLMMLEKNPALEILSRTFGLKLDN